MKNPEDMSWTTHLQLTLLINKKEIERRIKAIAKQLFIDYEGEEITIIMIMKGSFFLVADLMRELTFPVRLEFIQCKSYGEGGIYKGELCIEGLDFLGLQGRNLLIVDDIFDTGETLSEVVKASKKKGALSIRSLVLLTKNVPRKTNYRPDYSLFDIENRFVVGYGLDYKEYYRGLADIYAIQNPREKAEDIL